MAQPRLMAEFQVARERAGFELSARFEHDDGILVLFGPSGSGKTSVLLCLAGLLPPRSGRIVLDGRTLDEPASGTHVPPQERRLAYVPQGYGLFPHLRVVENVLFGLDSARRPDAVAILRDLGLAGLERRKPHELSGGQRQRVALARALVRQPRLILLDEPFAALDAAAKDRAKRLVQDVGAAHGVPVVLVTHDPEDARELASRVVRFGPQQ